MQNEISTTNLEIKPIHIPMRKKVFNFFLFFGLFLLISPIFFYFNLDSNNPHRNSDKDLFYIIFSPLMGLLSFYEYFESVNYFNNEKWIQKGKSLKKFFEDIFEDVFKFAFWIIKTGLILGFFYLLFTFLGTLSIPAILTIIIFFFILAS